MIEKTKVIDWHRQILPTKYIVQQVVRTCLEKAARYGFQSIAFPLLGTGTGRLTAEVALKIILKQIIKELSDGNQNVIEVIVALYGRVGIA